MSKTCTFLERCEFEKHKANFLPKNIAPARNVKWDVATFEFNETISANRLA
jgi:hypothetical protein